MTNKDKVSGKVGEMKGDVKETAGEALGDKDLQREGKADRVEGRAQQVKGDIKQTAKDITR